MVIYDLMWFGMIAPESSQRRILKALLLGLRPMAKMLLQAGVGFGEFEKAAKKAFVDVASKEYGIRGRPTNTSRVAAITGISRKEVGRIRARAIDEDFSAVKGTPAGEVLHHWHTSPKYLDTNGLPCSLAQGTGANSFHALVKEVVGDIPSGAIKSELLRVQAVDEPAPGILRVIKRYYVPATVDDRLLHGLDTAIRYLGDTIAYNTDSQNNLAPRFERVVGSVKVPEHRFDEIAETSEALLERFTTEYDDYLSGLEVPGKLESAGAEIGIGVYFFRVEKEG